MNKNAKIRIPAGLYVPTREGNIKLWSKENNEHKNLNYLQLWKLHMSSFGLNDTRLFRFGVWDVYIVRDFSFDFNNYFYNCAGGIYRYDHHRYFKHGKPRKLRKAK